MCGGTVRVFVHEFGADALEPLEAAAEARAAGESVAMATLLEGEQAGTTIAILADRVVGSLGVSELLDRSVERDARGQLDEGVSRIRRYGSGGEVMGAELPVYIQAFSTPPRMVIFGAIDFSAELAGRRRRDRLRGHDLRCPRTVPEQPPVLAQGRGRGRLARPLSTRSGAGSARRDPRLHPRPQVRRAGTDRGTRHRRRLRRRARQPAHAGATGRAAPRRRPG